jgi:hypothetical protein
MSNVVKLNRHTGLLDHTGKPISQQRRYEASSYQGRLA